MSDPINSADVQVRLLLAFQDALDVYFNDDLLEGALRIPMGVPTPGMLPMRASSVTKILRLPDWQAGMGFSTVRQGIQDLFQDVMSGKKSGTHPDGSQQLAVFQSVPQITVGAFSKRDARWTMVMACEVGWVWDNRQDLGHLPFAFKD